ncbi:MAG: hypothetical protein JNJ77_12260 [Planctomycetia bacterium]|nr:hypothetical protein [Planctomycetia bacterium]
MIERQALQSVRIYRKMKSGEKRDDILGLSELNIEQDPKGNDPKPMTQEEESLWNVLRKRSYGQLCAWTYEKEHWSRSEALTQMFSQMKEVTPLSTWEAGYQQQSAFWKALVDFRNSNFKVLDQRPSIGFQCENGTTVWKLLPYSDVLVYSESLSNKSARTFVSFSGRQIETRMNELLFDAPNQRLVEFRHIGTSRLDDSEP